MKFNQERADWYLRTLHDPCQFCGHTWHLHEETCPNYRGNERCEVQHSPFLRSMDSTRAKGKFEYECNNCSIRPTFSDVELHWGPHPFCAKGKHHYSGMCDMGCCKSKCLDCGLEEKYETRN
jgi:hypothetical protein